jgi:hypothetical protein
MIFILISGDVLDYEYPHYGMEQILYFHVPYHLKHSYLIYEQPTMSESFDFHDTMERTFIDDCKRIKIRHNLSLVPFTTFLRRSDPRAFNRSRLSACIDTRQDFDDALKKIKDKN